MWPLGPQGFKVGMVWRLKYEEYLYIHTSCLGPLNCASLFSNARISGCSGRDFSAKLVEIKGSVFEWLCGKWAVEAGIAVIGAATRWRCVLSDEIPAS